VLSVLVVVGTVLGQEPEPNTDPAQVEEGAGTEGGLGVMARPAKTMNYQGYLTDGSGSPLNGNYDLVFSLWDAEAAGAGTKEWGDETHNNVPVSNGLFTVVLGESLALDPFTDFDEQLYLEITINGTTLPRQMLRAVPYAMGLTVGAAAIGATETSGQYGLWVENNNGPGLYVNGSATYGIFNHDVTRSDDGYAGPDTYVFVPILNAVLPYVSPGEHLSPQNGTHMLVVADSAGSATVYIPLQIERPYGRDYLLRNARVYYRTSEASITGARIMGVNLADGSTPTIGSNLDAHSSTSFSTFDIQATQSYTVTYNMAPSSIALTIQMDSSFGLVYLYGVRLTLDSTY
jgi:hypothetical protein